MYEHANMTNLNSIIFSFFMILILFTFKEWIEPMLKKRNSFPIPIDLLMVIFAILLSWLFKFNQTFDIQVVKNVPTGYVQWFLLLLLVLVLSKQMLKFLNVIVISLYNLSCVWSFEFRSSPSIVGFRLISFWDGLVTLV